MKLSYLGHGNVVLSFVVLFSVVSGIYKSSSILMYYTIFADLNKTT